MIRGKSAADSGSAGPGAGRGLVALGAAAALFSVALGASPAVAGATPGAANEAEYVALGSSFGAGPGVPERAAGSLASCIRSGNNYAHLLAAKRVLALTDETCTGATAQQVLHGGQFGQPPQVDAIKPSTRLITITAGGNDIFYLPNLFAWSCANKPEVVSTKWRKAGVCDIKSDAAVDEQLAHLGASLRQIGQEAHKRAPDATVVYVDYTTVLPDTGYCPDRLPVSNKDVDRSRVLARKLRSLTAEAAADTGSVLVSAAQVTQGHDICSASPWVYGFTFTSEPSNYGPMAYHPTRTAMQTIADTIDTKLPDRLRG